MVGKLCYREYADVGEWYLLEMCHNCRSNKQNKNKERKCLSSKVFQFAICCVAVRYYNAIMLHNNEEKCSIYTKSFVTLKDHSLTVICTLTLCYIVQYCY